MTPGAVVIVTGYERTELTPYFTSVRPAATVPAQDGIHNEEVGRAVWLCQGLKMPWAAVAQLLVTCDALGGGARDPGDHW